MTCSANRFAASHLIRALLITCGVLCLVAADKPAGKGEFARWEKDIAAFEKADADAPPPKTGVLFVGSSSIRRWSLDKSFPEKHYINRGFGGSQLADSLHFADRLILKHEPRVVVVYAGDNDLAAGKSPEQVAGDFDALVKAIHGKLKETKIIYLAIKPSRARWKIVDKGRAANRLIAAACAKDSRFLFLDVATPMLGSDGMPRKELYLEDQLHMTDAGYRIWVDLLDPHLQPVKN